jgi:DNA-binding NarL/FixJ family response regulator
MARPPSRLDALAMAAIWTNPAESGVTCLLVDDSESVLDAMAALLHTEGIEILGSAETGVDALRLLAERPATVIVLDARLPDLSGFDVARRAAEIVRKQTPVIIYTSQGYPTLVGDALDVGARGVVLKDVPPDNLIQAIHAVAAGGMYVDPRLLPETRRNGR